MKLIAASGNELHKRTLDKKELLHHQTSVFQSFGFSLNLVGSRSQCYVVNQLNSQDKRFPAIRSENSILKKNSK